MISPLVLVLSALISVASCADNLKFPPGFKFGAATASYQIEGAWNVSDKGESIWDRHAHRVPSVIADGSTGDVACDSYHRWKEDVQLAVNLGLHFYRFSLSWTRILPSGFPDHISEDGKNYYSNLIDELLANGIEPVVTLYHWDLPQKLQDLGGWTNPLITDWFADYARVVYSLYADRVKNWLTLNEPLVICDLSYNAFVLAPGVVDPDRANYICNKNAMIAHAKAYRIYDEEFKPKYHGKVTIANHLLWFEPASESPEDVKVAELAREYGTGRFSHPIFSKEGGWPPVIEKLVAENSKNEGYFRSRLPEFTDEEIKLVRGSYDYYAFNHYTSRIVSKAKDGAKLAPWPFGDAPELGAHLGCHPDWPKASSMWFFVYPEGIRRQLAWIKEKYGDLEFVITENGYSSSRSGLDDEERVQYYRDYLEQVLLAIKEDGVNVTGYTAWTLIDNFEWMDGYRNKFGLHEVDFSSPSRTRTPRKSAHYYASIIKSHSLDVPTNFDYTNDEL